MSKEMRNEHCLCLLLYDNKLSENISFGEDVGDHEKGQGVSALECWGHAGDRIAAF